MSTIGERLKLIRESIGYAKTQKIFAESIGITQASLSDMEKGVTKGISTPLQMLLELKHKVNIGFLLAGEGDMFIGSSSVEIEIEDSPIKKSSRLLENIIAIRNKRNYTQEQVSSYLNMSQSGYALIERGERGLQFELLERIALLYDIDVVDIIKYPDVYVKKSSKSTRVLVELDVNDDELIKMGFKDKVIQVLNK